MSIDDIVFMHKLDKDEVLDLWNTGMMIEEGEPLERDAKVKENLMRDPYHYGRYLFSVSGGDNVEEMAKDPDEAFMHLAVEESEGVAKMYFDYNPLDKAIEDMAKADPGFVAMIEKFNDGGLVYNESGIEIKAYQTSPEHAKEYGLQANNPLYVQKVFINPDQRNQGKGKEALRMIEEFARKNNNDVVFGHIADNVQFSSGPDRMGYYEDMTLAKKWLRSKGYTVSVGNNDFHKVVKFEEGGMIKEPTLFDSTMQKEIFEEGGQVGAKVGAITWNEIPGANRQMPNIKKVKRSFDDLLKLSETFASQDELKPVMAHVYSDDDYIVATNGTYLSTIKFAVGKKEFHPTTFSKKKGITLKNDAEYVNWRNVIPSHKNECTVDAKRLWMLCNAVIKSNLTNRVTRQIALNFGETKIGVNASLLMDILEGLLKLGHEKPTVYYGEPNQALVFTKQGITTKLFDDDMFLIMPVILNEYRTGGKQIVTSDNIAQDIDFNVGLLGEYDVCTGMYSYKGSKYLIETGDYDQGLSREEIAIIRKMLPKNATIPITEQVRSDGKNLYTNDLQQELCIKNVNLKEGLYRLSGEGLFLTPDAADDFPRFKDFKEETSFEVGSDFMQAFGNCLEFTNDKSWNNKFHGIHIHMEDSEIAASDGYALIKYNGLIPKYDNNYVVRMKYLPILKQDGLLKLSFGYAKFESDKFIYTSKNIEHEYLDYKDKRFIPEKVSQEFKYDCAIPKFKKSEEIQVAFSENKMVFVDKDGNIKDSCEIEMNRLREEAVDLSKSLMLTMPMSINYYKESFVSFGLEIYERMSKYSGGEFLFTSPNKPVVSYLPELKKESKPKPETKKDLTVTAKKLSDLLKGAIDNNSKRVEVVFNKAYDESEHKNLPKKIKDSLKSEKKEFFHVIHEADDILSLVGSKDVKSIKYIPFQEAKNENVPQEVKTQFEDVPDDSNFSFIRLKDGVWRRDNATGEITNQGIPADFTMPNTDLKSEKNSLSELLESTILALEFDKNPDLEDLKEATEIALSVL